MKETCNIETLTNEVLQVLLLEFNNEYKKDNKKIKLEKEL